MYRLSHLIGNAWCMCSARRACSGISALEVGPTTGGPSMSKFLKHAWDFVVVCVRVHHAVELLLDHLDDLK